MSLVDDLAASRVVQNAIKFGGDTLPDQLVAGRDAALRVLQKYVPDFSVNDTSYTKGMRTVEAWAARNQSALVDAFNSGAETVAEEVRLQLGSNLAQAYVLATFCNAAIGLGPWMSGDVDTYATQSGMPVQISEEWARNDAAHRLTVFGSIVRMDQDGELEKIFVPPPGAAGFGAFVIPAALVWGIVVLFLGTLAILLWWKTTNATITANNKSLDAICKAEQQRGNTAAVQSCIAAHKDLASPSVVGDFGGITNMILLLAGAYVVFTVVLPALQRRQDAYGGYAPPPLLLGP